MERLCTNPELEPGRAGPVLNKKSPKGVSKALTGPGPGRPGYLGPLPTLYESFSHFCFDNQELPVKCDYTKNFSMYTKSELCGEIFKMQSPKKLNVIS